MARRRKEDKVEYFEDLYHHVAGPDATISPLLSGHLAIEFLLRRLAIRYDQNLAGIVDQLSHAQLISLNRDLKTISEQQAEFLTRINRIRNKFAHELQYSMDLQDVSSLFRSAIGVFSDYADQFENCITEINATGSLIQLDAGLLSELFLAIVYDLHQAIVKLGGDDEVP